MHLLNNPNMLKYYGSHCFDPQNYEPFLCVVLIWKHSFCNVTA